MNWNYETMKNTENKQWWKIFFLLFDDSFVEADFCFLKLNFLLPFSVFFFQLSVTSFYKNYIPFLFERRHRK